MSSLLLIALLVGPLEPSAPAEIADPAPAPVTETAPAPTTEADVESAGRAETESDRSDQVLIIDAEAVEPESSDDAILIIDDANDTPTAVPAPGPPSSASRTWLRTEITSRLMIDTELEDTGEDVVEWWNTGRLRLDHRLDAELRAVVEGWVRWGVAGEDPGPDHGFFVVNARDRKWTGEVELREGWVEWRRLDFEIRIGQQIFVWGKNEIMAAADILNPVDLRFDPLALLESLKDAKVPVFAFDVGYWVGDLGVQLVVLPFFTPNRALLIGRDTALAQPGSELEEKITAMKIGGDIHPSIEDELQSAVTGSRVPEESPLQASLALRSSASFAGIDVAATAFYGWDRTPRVRVDPDLALLLEAGDAILIDPQILVTDPELRDASLGVQQKAIAGEELVRARYRRMWRLALEGQGVVGDFVFRGDVGFSPGQTFYTSTLRPLWKNSLTAAVGVEYMRGEEWYLALTGYTLAVFRAPDDAIVLGVEADADDPSTRETAALWGGSATVRWRLTDRDVEIAASALYNVEPGDHMATVSVTYDGFEPHVFKIGGMTSDGPSGTLGRRYRNNEFVFLVYRVTF
ncbi:MAG: hypothetical protein V3T05_03870 [Myxococcota bacterium]